MCLDVERAKAERERWAKECLGARPVRPATTESGLEVDVLYTPDDLAQGDYFRDIGFPGEYPFTRGVYPSMYRGNLWSMRMYAGFGTAEDTNARYKWLLKQGNTGLSVAFDLPTQMGYDSDNPLIEEEVGRVGVAVDTLRDMEIIFDGMPLDQITTSFTINAPTAIILAMYVAVGEKQNVPPAKLGGTLQNDVLKEYLARGTYIFPPKPTLRLTTDVIEYCTYHLPRFNPISISGYHVREAGASAVQEIACGLSEAIAYVEEALKRGIEIDRFAPRLSFIFASHLDLFEEAAKFRACRRLWARIVKERWGAQDPRSCLMRFFVACAGAALTRREPLNNIIRATIQTLAMVLGGAQSVHVMSYDEAYAIPSEEAQRTALRTQQIIAYETGVTNTVDPLAGSYYVEWLTSRLEDEIKNYMQKIDDQGGIVAAIESGWLHREVLQRAYEEEQKTKSGEKIKVGVNMFVAEEEEKKRQTITLHRYDPETAQRQIARLTQVKAERDSAEVQAALGEVRAACEGNTNVMPSVLRAAKAYATLGEITDVMKSVFGTYRQPVNI